MAGKSAKIEVYLEIGEKKTFANAVEWPGWSRAGKDETAALQALVAYGPRYARAIKSSKLEFEAPEDVDGLVVTERVKGTSGTEFGVPEVTSEADERPVDTKEYERLRTLLRAYWKELDRIARKAEGKELRKGPRGGGRELEGVVRHVLNAEGGYCRRLGVKFTANEDGELDEELARERDAVMEALAIAERGEVPEKGPRGGAMWTPRYFVRRAAWHVLDHAWEIEDRIVPEGHSA
jgi:hypothetical protein